MSWWCSEGAQSYRSQAFLRWPCLAVGGISIPASYTAHISPIASSRHHSELLRRLKAGEQSTFETPYVVWLQAYDHLATLDPSDQIQELWIFQHPNPNIALQNSHNKRQAIARFRTSKARGKINGIAGYFEAVLYKDIQLSTRPDQIDSKSRDMFSWFPAYFPLKVSPLCPHLIIATLSGTSWRYWNRCIFLATYRWSESMVWMVRGRLFVNRRGSASRNDWWGRQGIEENQIWDDRNSQFGGEGK